jgi:hypothetical protein
MSVAAPFPADPIRARAIERGPRFRAPTFPGSAGERRSDPKEMRDE